MPKSQVNMRPTFRALVTPIFVATSSLLCAQCEADHTIVMADYYFAPAELTILPGETVAFVNVQGTHDINGITNTLTGASWNNPAEFYLEQTEGTEEGTCMGVVTFDTPGVYNFDSSIGFQAQLGMVGTITVDAFTLLDLMLSWNGDETAPGAWQSTYAMQYYCPACEAALSGVGAYTVFLPNDAAIDELGDLINLNQFDMLAIPDFQDILQYHIIEGIYLAEDLAPGMALPTLLGEDAMVGEGSGGGLTIDGVNIVETNYTAFNGVVHIIDYGMAPSSSPEATVYQIVVDSPDHTLFEQEINANLLNDDLIGQPVINDNEYAPGHFTVFAPTDAAIFAFAEENGFDDVNDLFDSPYWDEILRRHIVEIPLTSDQLDNNGLLVSYGGDAIYTFVNDDGIFVENAQLTTLDLEAYNGVVHVINEVIDFNFPNPVGTCGTWTLNMYAPGGEGWSGFMQVLVDNVLVGTPSIFDGTSNSFAFAVNEGSTVDMNYVSEYAGWPGNFEVVDAEGAVIFDSDSPSSTTPPFQSPSGVFGLKACASPSACGQIKVNLYSAFDGWDFGTIAVYDGIVLADVIGGYWFNGQHLIGYVDLEEGSEVDFVVNAGYFSTEHNYTVEDAEGNIIVDQIQNNVSPSSVLDVMVCDATSLVSETQRTLPMLHPNPTNGSLTLSGVPLDETWSLAVQDVQGRPVYSTTGLGQGRIHLESLASGMYLATISVSGQALQTMRLVVE